VDQAARYQLLDHATDESPLWDTRFGITTHAMDGRVFERHRVRTPEELRPELESLLCDGHVEICEMTDPEQRVLDLTEALAVIADDHNWYSPNALGEPERRETIYALLLSESGGEQFRLERERANPS
jgi:hypothetical protein